MANRRGRYLHGGPEPPAARGRAAIPARREPRLDARANKPAARPAQLPVATPAARRQSRDIGREAPAAMGPGPRGTTRRALSARGRKRRRTTRLRRCGACLAEAGALRRRGVPELPGTAVLAQGRKDVRWWRGGAAPRPDAAPPAGPRGP